MHTYVYKAPALQVYGGEAVTTVIESSFIGNPDLSGEIAIIAPPDGVPLYDDELRAVQVPGVSILDFVGDYMRREAANALQDMADGGAYTKATEQEIARLADLEGADFVAELLAVHAWLWGTRNGTNHIINREFVAANNAVRAFSRMTLNHAASFRPDPRGSRREIAPAE